MANLFRDGSTGKNFRVKKATYVNPLVVLAMPLKKPEKQPPLQATKKSY
jgi:hypothetical protein